MFLLVTVRDGAWILGVPDAGGAGPLLAQLTDRIFGYALVVEPAQVLGGDSRADGRPGGRPDHRRGARPLPSAASRGSTSAICIPRRAAR